MGFTKDETFDEKNNSGDKIFWNVSKMRMYLNNNIPMRGFNINKLYEYNQSPINKEYVMETNYKNHGIIIELIKDKNIYKLIDGNHRLYKAKITGEEYFNCYYLVFDEHFKFVIDIDNNPINLKKN